MSKKAPNGFEDIQDQVTAEAYSGVSDYLRNLIRADQRNRAEERVDALLLEGLSSGEPIEVTPEYWETKKRELTERLSKANNNEKTSRNSSGDR